VGEALQARASSAALREEPRPRHGGADPAVTLADGVYFSLEMTPVSLCFEVPPIRAFSEATEHAKILIECFQSSNVRLTLG